MTSSGQRSQSNGSRLRQHLKAHRLKLHWLDMHPRSAGQGRSRRRAPDATQASLRAPIDESGASLPGSALIWVRCGSAGVGAPQREPFGDGDYEGGGDVADAVEAGRAVAGGLVALDLLLNPSRQALPSTSAGRCSPTHWMAAQMTCAELLVRAADAVAHTGSPSRAVGMVEAAMGLVGNDTEPEARASSSNGRATIAG